MPKFCANLTFLFNEHAFMQRFRPAAQAALKLRESGIKLLIEPINTIDIPGFYLTRSAEGFGWAKSYLTACPRGA